MKTWTSDSPKEVGYYWQRYGLNKKSAKIIFLNEYDLINMEIAYVPPVELKCQNIGHFMNTGRDIAEIEHKSLDEFTTWWYGPITQPE